MLLCHHICFQYNEFFCPAIMFTSCIVWVTIEDGAHLISHYYFLYFLR